MKLKNLVIFFFISSATAIEINCDFNVTEDDPITGAVYECNVQFILNPVENPSQITGVTGTHLEGYCSSNVKSVVFDNNPLTAIPQNILCFFPNLIALRVIRGQFGFTVKEIYGNELIEYENLQVFALEQTDLVRNPGNLFASNSALRHVSFSNNSVQNVGENVLNNLPLLESADFLMNVCIDDKAANLEELKELKEILLKFCPDSVL